MSQQLPMPPPPLSAEKNTVWKQQQHQYAHHRLKRYFSKQQTWSEVIRGRVASGTGGDNNDDRPVWSEEWKRLGLGAKLIDKPIFPPNLFFVQVGFGIDQHGDRADATKAATRAVRNAIEFNSIPGVISHIPGGRKQMMIHVKLGVPQVSEVEETIVDVLEVAKVFPYGQLLPIEIVHGGLDFATGRVVEELGDSDDIGICVCASVSIGYGNDDGETSSSGSGTGVSHKTFNTKDGY